MKNVKQANLNIKLKDLFDKWLDITKAYHGLTTQQQKVLALFLYHHYKLKQDITNSKILWKMVFDYDTKHLIKEELGLKDAGIQNILSKFRSKGIIVDNQIAKYYIPEIDKDTNNFKIIFNFNIIHE